MPNRPSLWERLRRQPIHDGPGVIWLALLAAIVVFVVLLIFRAIDEQGITTVIVPVLLGR